MIGLSITFPDKFGLSITFPDKFSHCVEDGCGVNQVDNVTLERLQSIDNTYSSPVE